jgi:hypothetical protein
MKESILGAISVIYFNIFKYEQHKDPKTCNILRIYSRNELLPVRTRTTATRVGLNIYHVSDI